jgi:hypothetical protein
MRNQDNSRKWMWWFLGVVLAMQLYFVRELLAAFALFVLGFAVLAFIVVALYLLHHGWAMAVEGLAASQNPAVTYARRNVNAAEEFVRRGFGATFAGTEELAKRAFAAPAQPPPAK